MSYYRPNGLIFDSSCYVFETGLALSEFVDQLCVVRLIVNYLFSVSLCPISDSISSRWHFQFSLPDVLISQNHCFAVCMFAFQCSNPTPITGGRVPNSKITVLVIYWLTCIPKQTLKYARFRPVRAKRFAKGV